VRAEEFSNPRHTAGLATRSINLLPMTACLSTSKLTGQTFQLRDLKHRFRTHREEKLIRNVAQPNFCIQGKVYLNCHFLKYSPLWQSIDCSSSFSFSSSYFSSSSSSLLIRIFPDFHTCSLSQRDCICSSSCCSKPWETTSSSCRGRSRSWHGWREGDICRH
jgi:hypothetical protein